VPASQVHPSPTQMMMVGLRYTARNTVGRQVALLRCCLPRRVRARLSVGALALPASANVQHARIGLLSVGPPLTCQRLEAEAMLFVLHLQPGQQPPLQPGDSSSSFQPASKAVARRMRASATFSRGAPASHTFMRMHGVPLRHALSLAPQVKDQQHLHILIQC